MNKSGLAVVAVVGVIFAAFGFLYLTNRLCRAPLNLCFRTSPAQHFLNQAAPKASPKQQEINQLATGTANPNDPAAKFLGPSASANF